MNCERIDERLLGVTAAAPQPEFDAAELDHLRSCPRCREKADEALAAFSRIARASSPAALPGPGYWGSIVPRLRARIGAEPRGISRAWSPALRTSLMPVAAAVVLAIVAVVTLTRAPQGAPEAADATVADAAGTETLASLSDAEIHELRLAGGTTGLLQTAETNVTSDWTIADFLSDLASEDGDSVLYAAAEPEELIARVDDAEFARIVSILEHQ